MANYQTIPVAAPKRNQQKNNIFSVGTTDFGRLQPVGTFEVVPGDKVSLTLRTFVRAAPPSVPVYGRIRVHTDAFFVPYRILWSEWDNYIAGNTDSTPPFTTVSTLNSQTNAYQPTGSGVYASEQSFQLAQDIERVLAGLKYPRSCFAPPPAANNTLLTKRLSLFPFRAYKQIWWDYYRDSVNIPENNKSTYIATTGGVSAALTTDKVDGHPEIYYRCFGKDYLTTALPSANGSLPSSMLSSVSGATALGLEGTVGSFEASYNSHNTLNADSGFIPAIPIQAIRAANALQRYMEKNNIVGTRLISRLLARFGVAPSAERLQRAEYLGSNIFTMKVNDIDASESTDLVSEAGESTIYNAFGSSESFANIRGQATGKITGGSDGQNFNYSATEHGIIIILQSIMPDESYFQGLDRSMIRGLSTPNADRFDFYTPEFENLGYQPVLASDVYLPERGDNPTFYDSYDPNKVFGYQPRYSDYKFMRHLLFGDFTSSIFNTGMDAFHLFRDLSFFGEEGNQDSMVISSVFNTLGINERIQFDRIFQIPTTKISVKVGTTSSSSTKEVTATLDHFQLYNSISYSANRPMSGDDMPELVAGENAGDGKHISVPTGGIRM